jgi:hypothetical protein
VFTARYALSPHIKQTRFVFKGLITCAPVLCNVTSRHCLPPLLYFPHSKEWNFLFHYSPVSNSLHHLVQEYGDELIISLYILSRAVILLPYEPLNWKCLIGPKVKKKLWWSNFHERSHQCEMPLFQSVIIPSLYQPRFFTVVKKRRSTHRTPYVCFCYTSLCNAFLCTLCRLAIMLGTTVPS